ncbi:MAG: tetratricopeptide repeat protein [Planctomycetota bacterium]|nr:tetratricopeptide repeat protein [Planctomycetota bacterium]
MPAARLATIVAALAAVTITAHAAVFESPADALAALRTDGEISPDTLDEAARALTTAASAEPKNDDWQIGLALIAQRRDKWDDAIDHAEKAINLDPNVAEHHYILGNACFGGINEASLFRKGSLASQGRKAYQTAIELDPSHIGAHMGLFEFYMNAPGIAGGSKKKAREVAEQLSNVSGAEFAGQSLLARMAADEKDWDAFAAACAKARETAPDERRVDQMHMFEGQILLTSKNDPRAALTAFSRVKTPTTTSLYLTGLAHRALGDDQQAIALFEQVLAEDPNARNTRYNLAELCEKVGRASDARTHYQEFINRFPDDDRASKAKKQLRRLN